MQFFKEEKNRSSVRNLKYESYYEIVIAVCVAVYIPIDMYSIQMINER